MKPKETPRSDPTANIRAALQLRGEIDRARSERNAADALAGRLMETLATLLGGLSEGDREEYRRRIDELAAPSQHRGGEVYGNVIALFKNSKRREWSIPEIQDALDKQAKSADPKAVYNTLNYFAKTGLLKRVARGRYVVLGIGAGLDIDGISDDGTTRMTEHED